MGQAIGCTNRHSQSGSLVLGLCLVSCQLVSCFSLCSSSALGLLRSVNLREQSSPLLEVGHKNPAFPGTPTFGKQRNQIPPCGYLKWAVRSSPGSFLHKRCRSSYFVDDVQLRFTYEYRNSETAPLLSYVVVHRYCRTRDYGPVGLIRC